jgi:alkylated DNA repair dioxygenase AlkB
VLDYFMQQSLFEVESRPIEIPGFSLKSDYVSFTEERELLAEVDQGPWENEWRRRIQQ